MSIRLRFKSSYKSVRMLADIELPDFVLLTGVNGAGKTHLLEAMERGGIEVNGIVESHNNPVESKLIRRFDWTNIVPSDQGPFAPSQLAQERGALWQDLRSRIDRIFDEVGSQIQSIHPRLTSYERHELPALTAADLQFSGESQEQAEQVHKQLLQLLANVGGRALSEFVNADSNQRRFIGEQLTKNFPTTKLAALRDDDFYGTMPKSWQPVDVFQQSFGRLFASYQKDWQTNELKRLGKSRGEDVEFLSPEEFVAQNGQPPWDFVNRIFSAASLPFEINRPHKYEDRPYEPLLTNQISGHEVRFSDLSSGERVLMSFALCLYYAKDGRQRVRYPQVLLFDEIDAPLHPSMTHSLLKTISDVLVGEQNIKVIMSTHSPSTVALADEGWIYVMERTGANRLQKVSKDQALSVLTAGVPTLSVKYENRRQVFVESHYDAEYYEALYLKLRPQLSSEVSLTFISSGINTQGSSSHVLEAVGKLRSAGSKSVLGLLDWDLKNSSMDGVQVLGEGSRYSIENYLLDPLLVAAFLLREKWLSPSDVGVPQNAYSILESLDQRSRQLLVDFVADRVQMRGDPVTCSYVAGADVTIPKEYLVRRGHDLENDLKTAFPQLLRFRNEPDLKREIIRKVCDDYPGLIPLEVKVQFAKLQAVAAI